MLPNIFNIENRAVLAYFFIAMLGFNYTGTAHAQAATHELFERYLTIDIAIFFNQRLH